MMRQKVRDSPFWIYCCFEYYRVGRHQSFETARPAIPVDLAPVINTKKKVTARRKGGYLHPTHIYISEQPPHSDNHGTRTPSP